jgi:hypothetical protein
MQSWVCSPSVHPKYSIVCNSLAGLFAQTYGETELLFQLLATPLVSQVIDEVALVSMRELYDNTRSASESHNAFFAGAASVGQSGSSPGSGSYSKADTKKTLSVTDSKTGPSVIVKPDVKVKNTDSKTNALVTDSYMVVKPDVLATEGVKVKTTDGDKAVTDGKTAASVTDGKAAVKPDVVATEGVNKTQTVDASASASVRMLMRVHARVVVSSCFVAKPRVLWVEAGTVVCFAVGNTLSPSLVFLSPSPPPPPSCVQAHAQSASASVSLEIANITCGHQTAVVHGSATGQPAPCASASSSVRLCVRVLFFVVVVS